MIQVAAFLFILIVLVCAAPIIFAFIAFFWPQILAAIVVTLVAIPLVALWKGGGESLYRRKVEEPISLLWSNFWQAAWRRVRGRREHITY